MLLQTNSYIVPPDKRAEHARLLRRFRQALARLGCDSFEVYEQVGSNWNAAEVSGRVVQIMRFRDRRHQLAVQAAERNDPVSQAIIAEFCNLINFPYQQQQGLFAVGFYNAVLPVGPARGQEGPAPESPAADAPAADAPPADAPLTPEAAAAAVAGAGAVAAAVATPEPELAAGDLAREEALAAQLHDSPLHDAPLHDARLHDAPAATPEAHVFAEETAGIISAAEHLTDEELDAGGDAAMAAAAAGPEAAGAGPRAPAAGANGSPEHVEVRVQEAVPERLAGQAGEPARAATTDPGPAADEALDLSALLDPHVDPADAAGQAQAGDPASEPAWEDALSLDGVLDEPGQGEHEDHPGGPSALREQLEGGVERDRDHVSQ